MSVGHDINTGIVTRTPPIPGKYDIIPIHSSDVASFKRCRRYWNWTSPTRSNLRRRVDIYGISFPLFFGSAIHYALEMYYDPVLRHDPVEAFKTYWQYNWEGGVVSEDWLERTYDIHPVIQDGVKEWKEKGEILPKLYKIRGLQEILPDPIEAEFEEHRELGIGMMTFYRDYAEEHDNFVPVAPESTYSIPLGFEAKDIREESPNYGKMLEVHARGKRDTVIYFPEYDRFGILENKTAKVINEEYFLKLAKDEQVSNYLWATMQEADMHGYPWEGRLVDRVVYNALRKNYPKPPIITAHGFPSIDRQKQSTTAELFQEAIVGNPQYEEWFRNDERAQNFYMYLVEQGVSLFIQRDLVTRNKYEVAATGEHLKMIAKEITSDPAIYPNPTGEYRCLQCAFRNPCIAADDGSDWQGMLNEAYEQNKDR